MRLHLSTRLLVAALSAGLMLFAAGCNSTSHSAQQDAPDWHTLGFVQDAGGNPSSSFGAGQHIQFVAELQNASASTQSLKFPLPNYYKFEVRDASTGDLVWSYQLADSTTMIQVSTSLTLAAGQSDQFAYTWDQLGLNSQAIPPGDYELQARILTSADTAPENDLTPSPYRSKLIKFTIQP